MTQSYSLRNGLTVLFTTFVDYVGLGMSLVLLPNAILSESGILPEATSMTTRTMLMGLIMMLYPLGQLVGAPLIARASDRFGKKKMLLLSLIGTLAGTMVLTGAFVYKSLIFALFGRLFTGAFAANTAIVDSYMAHLSTPKTKSRNLGLTQAAFGIGWIIGPLMAGLFTKSWAFWGLSTPLWIVAALLCLNILIVWIMLDEHINTSVAPTHIFKRIKQIVKTLTKAPDSTLFVTWAMFIFGWALYVQFMTGFLAKQYGFDAGASSKAFAFMGAIYTVNQLITVRYLNKRMRARTIMFFAMPLTAFGLIVASCLTSATYLYIPLALFATAIAFARTNILSALSNATPAKHQGETMGLTWSIQALSLVLAASPIGGLLFRYAPPTPLIAGGVCMILSWIFAMFFLRHSDNPTA
jgi:MFS transporter, DHA1 family, tetracycline resistance protein